MRADSNSIQHMLALPLPTCLLSVRNVRRGCLLFLLVFSWLASASFAQEKSEAAPLNRVRKQDQFWMLSTREIGCADEGEVIPQRLVGSEWQRTTIDQFLGSLSPKIVTIFYIHGNRKDAPGSVVDGLATYHELVGKFADERPVCFLVWTWPSEQIPRPLKDVRVKADRSDEEAWMLANLLSRFPDETPLSFVGFSLGCRITCGALQLLEGGDLAGRTLENPKRFPVRAVFWAAAVHNDWLLEGQYHGNAMQAIDRLLILVNSCDSALKYYHLLERDRCPALGYAGLSGGMSPDLLKRVEQRKVENLIGQEHDSEPYLYAPYITQRAREYALWYQVNTGDASLKKTGYVTPTAAPAPVWNSATIATRPMVPLAQPRQLPAR